MSSALKNGSAAAVVLVVAAFIGHNEYRARSEAAAKLEQHARVIANALWNLDRAGPRDYLQQAIQNDHYEVLLVTASDGETFYSGTGLPSSSLVDRVLTSINVIPPTALHAEVTWQGRTIGRIQATARIPTIHADFYALVVGALVLIVGRLYLRLAASNRDLDAKVRELGAARDAAHEASQAKSRFLANMSHEIRTPMNAVLGFAQLLLRDSELTADQRKHLETISRAGDHLMALIDGILQLAKVEAGHESLHDSSFDLRGLLDDVKRLFESRALQKGLTIAVQASADVPRFIRADEGKLRQVLSNLIGNAVKFTTKGGVIVRVGATMGDRQRLHFEVADTGPGISQSDIGRLFQKFEQTEAGRRSQQGTGLGLALCREFVRLMGGQIEVDSQYGRGSVFRFEIPFVLVASGQLPQVGLVRRSTRLVKESGRDYRVLVADDIDDNRTLVTNLLTLVGFDVKECADGTQAVALFETWPAPLLLIDRHMPQMDGLEAIRRIRRSPGGDRVKIVCISASVYGDDQQAALAAGADAFLNKPIRDGLLLEQIGQLLGVRYQDVEANAGPSVTAKDTAVLEASDLARLPSALREELRQAALRASLGNLRASIDKIAAQDEQLAVALSALVDQFAYARILGLLSGTPTK
jgi:signal transduction histidine kinase/DNA-binding response OmpR family regulator